MNSSGVSGEMEADILQVESPGFEQIPQWILFHKDATPNAIRLYLVLRYFARGSGIAFPSRRTLAELTDVSMPTVDRSRKVLEEIGALKSSARNSGSGQTSNLYVLAWNPPLITDDEGGSSSMNRAPHQILHTNTYTTKDIHIETDKDLSIIEPASGTDVATLPDQSRPRISTGRSPYSPEYEQFWKVYPRRVGKRVAWDVWRSALQSGVSAEEIIAGAERYRGDPNREDQFTAHPSTWLRRGGWEDDPIPAKARRQTGGSARMDQYADIHARINRARGEITA